MKMFYRVCNTKTQQGLWYRFNGDFSGLIHNEFDFCKNSFLKMDFDLELVGWLSATDSLDTLFNWFSEEDIKRLQDHGWFIHVYETDSYKFYERFQHTIINQEKLRLVGKMVL